MKKSLTTLLIVVSICAGSCSKGYDSKYSWSISAMTGEITENGKVIETPREELSEAEIIAKVDAQDDANCRRWMESLRAEQQKRVDAYSKELRESVKQVQPKNQSYKIDTLGAFTMAQDFVTSSLKCPRTAKWPWVSYSKVTVHLGDGRYQISSYLDAQNSFGAMMRTHFICIVIDVGNGKWRLENLIF